MIFKLSIGPQDYVLQLEAKNWKPLISKKVFAKSLESLAFSTSMQTCRLSFCLLPWIGIITFITSGGIIPQLTTQLDGEKREKAIALRKVWAKRTVHSLCLRHFPKSTSFRKVHMIVEILEINSGKTNCLYSSWCTLQFEGCCVRAGIKGWIWLWAMIYSLELLLNLVKSDGKSVDWK